jgi:hypothetical protein
MVNKGMIKKEWLKKYLARVRMRANSFQLKSRPTTMNYP